MHKIMDNWYICDLNAAFRFRAKFQFWDMKLDIYALTWDFDIFDAIVSEFLFRKHFLRAYKVEL